MKWPAVLPGDGGGGLKEAAGQQQGMVGAAADAYADLLSGDRDPGGGVEKPPEDLLGLSPLEAGQASGQLAIQGVGHQSQHHVQVDLQGDGGTEGVEVKAIDGIGDAVFNKYA